MIEFHFFGMPIKTLGSLGKIRVGRVTGNTHILFFGLSIFPNKLISTYLLYLEICLSVFLLHSIYFKLCFQFYLMLNYAKMQKK